tara:strand:+ start:98 stop:820 length:723 start_codon:yes stop_codon:yes gene_type:complete
MGDCIKVMEGIADKSIDMILTDLPYGTTACDWDNIIPYDELWTGFKRIIKDNSAIVLSANQPFTSWLVTTNVGMFKHEWVWDKHIPRGFQVAKYRPMRKHEDILVFARGKVNYYPIKTLRDKPVTVKNYGNSKSSHIGKYNDKTKSFTYTHRNPDTIITGKWMANRGKLHPTQKPTSLYEYLIKTYTLEGQLVLDVCAGSGTTGEACKNIGRNYILIEQEKEYCDIISSRIGIEISTYNA